ncbi:FAD-dependent monooxygenase [Saccharopolyspora rosea]|uniref:FAD-dependent monooxygenase n=1 Tax=Saccharopolyspora rosea TaxID=524884 RepID=A0ABW3FYV9_9PSEU|nr:FAD-dependent monooxygenase [Saccharopolyspora rosea]
MKIACVGGGPAGLYFAISAKMRDAGHDITVFERDPRGATYGWGVVYWDDLLDVLFRNDRESAQRIRAESALWQEQETRLRGTDSAYLGGYGYSINRAPLLEILADRAIGLGVDVQYERPVEDAAELSDADLVVVADGANSRIRQQHAEQFGTTVSQGSNPYIWLGTPKVFDKFTFAFEETPAGWIWFHAYPSSEGVSTCIVECTERTWRALGFEEADNAETVRRLEKIFEQPLEGQPLISESRGRPARWLRFTQVYNQTWRHDGMVLVGDAAHTTHFTIGSGTRLAMIDAIMLAQKLYEHGEVDAALKEFDEQGHEALRPVQASARTSMSWFEHADDYLNRNAVDFCYAMAARHGLQPPWQYQRHRLHQIPLMRKAARATNTGRRWLLALRRGETR